MVSAWRLRREDSQPALDSWRLLGKASPQVEKAGRQDRAKLYRLNKKRGSVCMGHMADRKGRLERADMEKDNSFTRARIEHGLSTD